MTIVVETTKPDSPVTQETETSEEARNGYLAYRVASSMLWAIVPDMLETILAIAAREGEGVQAVAARQGRKLENTRRVEYRGSVAIIPIEGVISRRMNLFGEVSGNSQTSVQALATDLTEALNNPSIKAILLNVDSPGGQLNGISEMAQLIERGRKQKRIVAYVGGIGGSAAYWLAAAASEIVAYKNAEVGSIGVMGVYVPDDTKKRVFVSSQSPLKNPSLETDKGAAQYQNTVDTHAAIFIEDVARLRSVAVEKVQKDFGQGAMVIAGEAKKAKMIDRLSTFEDVLAEMQKTAETGPRKLAAQFEENELLITQLLLNEETDMGIKDTVRALMGSLSAEDKAELIKAESSATPAPVQPVAVAPVIQPQVTAPVQPVTQSPELQAALQRAITAECGAFITEMKAAGKITPAEEASARELYTQLAGMSDVSALNKWKASIQARPKSDMLSEKVSNDGNVTVLPSHRGEEKQTPEQEANALDRLLNMTPVGSEALTALRAGKIRADNRQFAVR